MRRFQVSKMSTKIQALIIDTYTTIIIRLCLINIPLNYMWTVRLFVGGEWEVTCTAITTEEWFIMDRLPKYWKVNWWIYFFAETRNCWTEEEKRKREKKTEFERWKFDFLILMRLLSNFWRFFHLSSASLSTSTRNDSNQWLWLSIRWLWEIKLNEISLVPWINVKFPNKQQ